MRCAGRCPQAPHHPRWRRRGAGTGGALAWRQARGPQQFYFKVCSTFDSTDAGNIGPVVDALLDALGETIAVVCPAYPANRRTVSQGHLFVGETWLPDWPMRHHPLTPMTDASPVRVLGRQSRHPVGLLPWSTVGTGDAAIEQEQMSTRCAASAEVLRSLPAAVRKLPEHSSRSWQAPT